MGNGAGHVLRGAPTGHPRQDHDELIAAITADDVARSRTRRDPARDGHQELIAERVPEAVVDAFEAIEVDEQDGESVLLRGRLQNALLEKLGPF